MAIANTPDADLPLFLSTQPGPTRSWEATAPSSPVAPLEIEAPAKKPLTGKVLRHTAVVFMVVFLFGTVFGIVNRFIVTSVIVQGRSMTPTLQDGERYLLDRWSYYRAEPQRGDIIVLEDPGHNDLAIKRIVGVPGDRLYLTRGGVVVNGERFHEPYLAPGTLTYPPNNRDQLVLLGPGQYFVLGDNRELSEDSRYYGPVSKVRIVGCVSM